MRPELKVVKGQEKKFVKVSDNLFLHTLTGVYYVRKTFRRYRIPDLFESTREEKITKAKAKAQQLITEHMTRYLAGDASPIARRRGTTVSKVIDEILETVTPTRRKGTQQNHRDYLGELAKEWGRWDIGRITLAAWSNWLPGFRARKKKRKTFADYAKNMNLVLRYAYRQRYVSHLLVLPNPDSGHQKAGRVFTKEEISRLWNVMNEDTRDQFALCFECFMRLREALYLTWDRVNLETGVITLRPEDVKTGSKTGKGRSFIASPNALERLRARRQRVGGPFVFPSPTDPLKPMHSNKKAWLTAKENAKVKGRARWHDLRHSALSIALLDSRAEPVLVSEYAGVSLRTIQRVYLHSTHEKTAAVAGAVKIF